MFSNPSQHEPAACNDQFSGRFSENSRGRRWHRHRRGFQGEVAESCPPESWRCRRIILGSAAPSVKSVHQCISASVHQCITETRAACDAYDSQEWPSAFSSMQTVCAGRCRRASRIPLSLATRDRFEGCKRRRHAGSIVSKAMIPTSIGSRFSEWPSTEARRRTEAYRAPYAPSAGAATSLHHSAPACRRLCNAPPRPKHAAFTKHLCITVRYHP